MTSVRLDGISLYIRDLLNWITAVYSSFVPAESATLGLVDRSDTRRHAIYSRYSPTF